MAAETRKKRRKFTVAEVRASQQVAKASPSLLWRWIAIPLTWPLTVVAARIGLSPNAVTSLRAVLVVFGMALIAQPSSVAFSIGLAIYAFAIVLDGVDGNLCRIQDGATYFGKFIDGVVDLLGDLLFPMAVSIHLWTSGRAEPGILLAGSACVLTLALVMILVHRLPMFELVLKSDLGESGVDAGRRAHPRLHAALTHGRLASVINHFDAAAMTAAFDIRYIALVVALATDHLVLYLFALAGLYACLAATFAAMRLAWAYTRLDVHRRSRSAA